ncbi:type III secretion system needle complex protein PrgI [Serratia fonticola]|uniref:type III secretion system needle complex protein n=1 Tax=Serratia fonticola TaxID=47917 RepID=UPI0008FED781|nr:type III secretion system needle complex protein [Serratia fonticola]CAI1685419.1 type III secretion system needle complex protein PrgI [Serratia fonticola]
MSINNVRAGEIPGSDWKGFLSESSKGFDDGVKALNESLDTALESLKADPSDPQNLAEYQSRLSEYTLYRNAQSNVVKVYKDVDSAIISNFR